MSRDHAKTRLHFVGIGGIGMSGIAEVFLNQGYVISGSDLVVSEITRRLEVQGAQITVGHSAANVGQADVVVISSAVRPENPEVLEARRRRIPVIPRAEMLGELMRGKTGIAVAGSHGKTTTTSMLAHVLTAAGVDPTIVIGGRVNAFGGNAKLGQGEYVVAEADESDGSFLHLPATFAIITNIDNDHMDHFGTLESLDRAFQQFAAKIPFYGLIAVCGEDLGVRRNISHFTKPVVTYGFSSSWDYWATEIRFEGLRTFFTANTRDGAGGERVLGHIELNVPGRHNVLNALSALAIAARLEIPFSEIASGLRDFTGVMRRFEICFVDEKNRRVIIDDYGHHPTEIAATLAVARQYWEGRIITVFQPHRYSRTLLCKDGFLSAFRASDVVLITDIYAAGEDPIAGVDSAGLAEAVRAAANPGQDIRHTGNLDQTAQATLEILQPGDMVLCLGAGTITRLPERLKAALIGT